MFNISLRRSQKVILQLFFDFFITIFALFIAYSLRLGHWYVPNGEILILFILSPFISLPILTYIRLYQQIIRYLDFDIIKLIFKGSLIYGLSWGFAAYFITLDGVPRSVMLINIGVFFLFILVSRFLIKDFLIYRKSKIINNEKTNVLIYGAGEAGRALLNSLRDSSRVIVRGFLDDNKDIQKTFVHGVKVFSIQDLGYLINKFKLIEIFLAFPSISNERKAKILNSIQKFSIPVKTLPNLSDYINKDISFKDIKPIDVSDLLGRTQVNAIQKLLKQDINNKIVLITGAGGTIGSELAKQVINQGAKKVLLIDHDEYSLYKLNNSLNSEGKNVSEIKLGSILSINFLENIMQNFVIDTIYHAAAYKHVPLLEDNIIEGLRNNILGTYNIAFLAGKYQVKKFVLISSDKAVRPTNVMGATKRVAEIIIKNLGNIHSNTKYTMVRFGNVLGSSGSVIPLFEKQIQNGGPVTVTDEKIVRFFMTINEAVELVIQAGALAKGNDLFLLDMGTPVKIYDLAIKMINLSGKTIRNKKNIFGDIEILFSGLRPGEKLYEELLIDAKARETEHKKIFSSEESYPEINLEKFVYETMKIIENTDDQGALELLSRLVDGYNPDKQLN